MTTSTNAAAVLQAAAAAAAAVVVASARAAADDCSRVHTHHVHRLLQTTTVAKTVTALQQFRVRVSTWWLLQRTYSQMEFTSHFCAQSTYKSANAATSCDSPLFKSAAVTALN
jgi:hypothetical protein